MTLVYEDGACTAELVEDGATLGQILIRPREKVQTLFDLPAGVGAHLFFVASFAATAVFEGIGAQGTNIIVQEGDDLQIVVLPRSQGDGLDLSWDAQRAEPASLESTASLLKDKLFYVGKARKEDKDDVAERTAVTRERADRSGVPPEDNYKLRQLRRGP